MKKDNAFTLVELMIVVGIIGILASLAIPNFMMFMAKAKQAEAKGNLGAIYTCQISYFSIANTFAGASGADGQNAFELINFTPLAGMNRYAYLLDDNAIIPAKFPLDLSALPAGVLSSAKGFTAIAAGNIDNDAFLDTWYVNDVQIFQNKDPNTGADGDDVTHQ
jgi:prepilin-type N-terminal cleavage/methylation domain-containing protein